MFWGGRLFNWSDRDELVPELADARPDASATATSARDGLSIVYHLRRGVTWQDGAPFTADDVIFTWQQMINPNNNVLVNALGYDVISPNRRKRRAHDRRASQAPVRAVRRRLFHAWPFHPDCILPKHLLAAYPNINRVPFNSCPSAPDRFASSRYEHGQRVVFVANPHYWRGAPKLQRDRLSISSERQHDPNAHAVASTSTSSFARPKRWRGACSDIPGTRVVLAPFTRFADIGINAGVPGARGRSRPPSARVRPPIAAALVDEVTHGVDMAGDTDQPPFFWAYDPQRAHVSVRSRTRRRAARCRRLAAWGRRHAREGRRAVALDVRRASPARRRRRPPKPSCKRSGAKLGIDVTIKNFPSRQLYATLAERRHRTDRQVRRRIRELGQRRPTPTTPFSSRAQWRRRPAGTSITSATRALDAAERTALSSYDAPRVRLAAYGPCKRR